MSSSVGSAPDGVVRLLKAAVVKSRGCGLRKCYAALKLVETLESAVVRPLPYVPWQPAHLVSKMTLPRLSRSASGSLVGERGGGGQASQVRQSPMAVPIFCM